MIDLPGIEPFKGAQAGIASLLGEVGRNGMSSEEKLLLNVIYPQTQWLPLDQNRAWNWSASKGSEPPDFSDFGLTPMLLITRGKRTSFYLPNNPKLCLQLFNKAKIISQSFLFSGSPQPSARGVDYSALTLFVQPHSGSEIVTKLFKLLCVWGGSNQHFCSSIQIKNLISCYNEPIQSYIY